MMSKGNPVKLSSTGRFKNVVADTVSKVSKLLYGMSAVCQSLSLNNLTKGPVYADASFVKAAHVLQLDIKSQV